MNKMELRIGNWVFGTIKSLPLKVISLGVDSIVVGLNDYRIEYSYDKVSPVRLDERWIDDFGFERGGYDMLEVHHPDNPRFIMCGYFDDNK